MKYGHSKAEGDTALSGGLASHILLRAGTSIMPIDDDLPSSIASPASCATATVMAAVDIAGDLADRRVLIFGAGMLGLTAAAFAKHSGAAAVAIVDISAQRLEQCSQFGAVGIESVTDPPWDVVLEMSGAPTAVQSAIDAVDLGGKVILVGSVMPSADVSVNPERMIRGCHSIHGIHNYAPKDLRAAVEFLNATREKYPWESLVERSFPLSDVNAAIESMQRSRPIRIAILPQLSN